ncbi:MAG: heme exporter protein B [Methanohalophilus sp.]|jgi:heme exporter protein B|nr:MAG: heme exporter protein B [Methanohalophilus sp.]
MLKGLNIAFKDLKIESRAREIFISMVVFSLLVLIIFSIAFSDLLSSASKTATVASGVLWICFIFAGTLGLNRTFATEVQNGCMDALKMCPIPRNSIYLSKVIFVFLLMLLVEIITIPMFSVLFNYQFTGIIWVGIVILLGSFGFVVVGCLISALVIRARAGEMLLPVLLLPLSLPVIIPAVSATSGLLRGEDIFSLMSYIRLLVVYDFVFFAVSMLVFEYVVED